MNGNLITAILLLIAKISFVQTPIPYPENIVIPEAIVEFLPQVDLDKHEYIHDLKEVTAISVYQGNVLLADPEAADFRYDVKKVYHTKHFTRVVDFPN